MQVGFFLCVFIHKYLQMRGACVYLWGMETFDEQMEKCDALAAEYSAKSGLPMCGNAIWRACYGINQLAASASSAATALKKLRLAQISRDGTKIKPFRFTDIAKRIK